MTARSRISVVLALFGLAASSTAAAAETELFERAAAVFEAHCTRCHSGPDAKMGLALDRENLYRSTVNVPARSTRRRVRVSPNRPSESLLYQVLLPAEQGGYRGPRMPFGGEPLPAEELATVRAWIESFPQHQWGAVVIAPETQVRKVRHFDSHRLGVLPTTQVLDRGWLEFRVDHRFRRDVEEAGFGDLFGLDGGAWVSLGLSYGLTDRFQTGLRRSNLYQDYELYGKWAVTSPTNDTARLRAALLVAYSRLDGEGLANRDSFTLQLPLSASIGKKVSLLAVPSYSTRTHPFDPEDQRSTTALGLSVAWRINDVISVQTEWVPQLAGVKAPYELFSANFAVTTSKHVFQVLVTNASGLHSDAYLPGGDLDIGSGELRLGFSISRLFDLAPKRNSIPKERP